MTDKRKKAKTASNTGPTIERRKQQAETMAKSPTTTVTLRIPTALNEWLTEYQHLSYPNRVGKGEIVVEGLILAYLRRGRPGEKILFDDEVLAVLRKSRK